MAARPSPRSPTTATTCTPITTPSGSTPTTLTFIIDGNDGGLNISHDGGDTWRFAENLPLGQFYHIAYDMSYPYLVGGGMQDNGSWVGPSQGLKSGGITDDDWQEVFFGDGFDMIFKPDEPADRLRGQSGRLPGHRAPAYGQDDLHPARAPRGGVPTLQLERADRPVAHRP